MTRQEAHKILSEIWPSHGGAVSWDDLIPVAEEIQRLRVQLRKMQDGKVDQTMAAGDHGGGQEGDNHPEA